MAMLVQLFVTTSSLAFTDVQPALDLVLRNFGINATKALDLHIDANLTACSSPCFTVAQAQSNGVVSIVATGMSELTYGIGYYTRFSCGLTIGWEHGGGSHVVDWSRGGCHGSSVLQPVTMERAVPYTYLDNVCTHSYSYAWYNEDAWIKHIDWMALRGVNIFLAMTGQEEVQYKTFIKMGFNDTDIREFFNGPAYLTWSRGQSMQSVGSSALPEGGSSGLPRSWMKAQWELQKKILGTTRPLGIIGVLPAFQGNLPPQAKTIWPTANITNTHHSRPAEENQTKGECSWLASTDPLFGRIADVWMQTLLADFGTDHWYQCDGFFTGAKPPWYAHTASDTDSTTDTDTTILPSDSPVQPDPQWTPVWKSAWEGMSRTDPDAKWLYQGWAIRGWRDVAGARRIKALHDAVPQGQWIPLDMDINGIWRYWGNYSFFHAPFIWTTLHNMGGNDGMKGDMRLLQDLPGAALSANASIIGVGGTPEGIDQNPPYYEYAMDTAWHATAQDLDEWFDGYAARRYGLLSSPSSGKDATEAWRLLQHSVYSSQEGGWHDDTGVEWNAVSPPPTPSTNLTAIFSAWQLLAKAAATIDPGVVETFNYDLVDVGREVLAHIITKMENNLTMAVTRHDKESALAIGSRLLRAYADLDELLGCSYSFLLGPWVRDAREWAQADAPASYYEWQARSQVSTWWPVPPSARRFPETYNELPILDNYANKHWNGLVRDFYAKRVLCYVHQISIDMAPAPPVQCTYRAEVANAFLPHYPGSLGTGGGDQPPSVWPYDTSSLSAAQGWCCHHDDCGGVTHQNGRFEARSGNIPIPHYGDGESSFPREGAGGGLNMTNVTRCVVQAEMDFTQSTATQYTTVATPHKTRELSQQLIQKYGVYVG